MIRVLITSSGGVNGMNVLNALARQHDIPLSLIAADSNPLSPSAFLGLKFYPLPKANQRSFIPRILWICKKEKIDVLLPMHSSELPTLAHHKKILESAGVRIAIPSAKTIEICWDKRKTHIFLKKERIPHPKMYTLNELRSNKKISFPLFIKSATGSGGSDAHIITTRRELDYFSTRLKGCIVQEYIYGKEYTVDSLGDRDGGAIAISPRIRLKVRGGLATQSITVSHSKIERYTEQIIRKLCIFGPVNIQCKLRKGIPHFFDINTRFASGGLPLAVEAGFNIPLLVVLMLMNKPLPKITIKKNVLMLRYWSALFIQKQSQRASYIPYDSSSNNFF